MFIAPLRVTYILNHLKRILTEPLLLLLFFLVIVKTSWDVHAALIIVLSQSGTTAASIAKYRPIAPVLAVTASPQVARQCQVLRGIYPLVTETMEGTDNIIHKAMLWGVRHGMAQPGDAVSFQTSHFS